MIFCKAQQKKAKILYISPEQIKGIEEQVTLECIVDFVDAIPIIWKKKDRDRPSEQTVLTVNREKVVADPRFALSFGNNTLEKTLNFSLIISSIKVTDSGIYECILEALESKDKVLKNVELQVRSPPEIIEKLSTLLVQAEEQQSITMKCYAEGYPRPTITWSRQSGKLLPEGSNVYLGPELRINNVSKEDRGVYYCTASNAVGDPAQKSINLEVDFAPVISVDRPKVAQAQGFAIDLECHVESHPPSQIFWTKDGKHINNNDEYHISHFGSINDMTVSKINILSVEKHHYGYYKCKASNKLGVSESKMYLYKPSIPAFYND